MNSVLLIQCSVCGNVFGVKNGRVGSRSLCSFQLEIIRMNNE